MPNNEKDEEKANQERIRARIQKLKEQTNAEDNWQQKRKRGDDSDKSPKPTERSGR